MASANPKKTYISQKLTFLKDRGELLIGAVGQYVIKIIAAGESWTGGGENTMEYLELCQMIDSAVVFLCDKCEELTGTSVDAAANQQSLPYCQQPDQTSQSTSTTSSTSATTYTYPAAPLASTATLIHKQPTETVQSADETMLKPVLARISVIEEALFSFRNNAENELLSKLSESDKKHNSRLRKVKEQISEINDTQVAIDQEQETRLQSLEKQLQKLSTAQDRMEVEMESQAELTEKLVHVPDQLESVKEKLDVLDARIGRIIDDCSNKHRDIEHVTRDLVDKVMANTDTVQVITEGQDQKTILLRELETRLQTLEADSGRSVKDVQKQAEKWETNLRMLCQMLNDRLTPLEQLRTCLNQGAITRDENIKKLSQVIQEVAVISPRLQQLEVKSSRTRCGFTAWTRFSKAKTGDTIKLYMNMYYNVGENFDGDSGIFTAPVDGLYVTSIALCLDENEEVVVCIGYRTQGEDESTDVCWTTAEVKDTSACSVAVVDMKAGDTLFSYVNKTKTDSYKSVDFSCFLLA